MESTVLFEDALFSELKSLSAEDLLVKCIGIIDGLDIPIKWPKDHLELNLLIEKNNILKELYVYCGELYRRNIIKIEQHSFKILGSSNSFEKVECYPFMYLYKKVLCDDCSICNEVSKKMYVMQKYGGAPQRDCLRPIKELFNEYDDLICLECKTKKEEKNDYEGGVQTNYLVFKNKYIKIGGHPQHGKELYIQITLFKEEDIFNRRNRMFMIMLSSLQYLYLQLETKLQEIQMVKETMLRIMKTPLLTKELEECMDEILDLNGNRISQLKEYLTEDQYRFVRSGAKFDELEDQQDMLNRMNKMLKQLKMTSIGETLLDLPVARPITPEIKHLERELESHNFRQKKHEKELEKLKRKI